MASGEAELSPPEASSPLPADGSSDLQPEEASALEVLHRSATLTVDLADHATDDRLRRRLASLERLAGDARLRDAMESEGFSGVVYRRFEWELVSYARSVLKGWLYSGSIFDLLAQRGIHLQPKEHEQLALQDDHQARDDLATMVIAVALPTFRERALVDGGWKPEGGAAIATFFMGASLYAFLNEFRTWRRLLGSHGAEVPVDDMGALIDVRLRPSNDPADAAVMGDQILRVLSSHKPRTREVVALHLAGYSHNEIAEMTNAHSAEAIEGVLYRWRTKEKSRAARKGQR